MIDDDGYRLNVGIILAGPEQHVFWGRRAGQLSWQFPQGGLIDKEDPEDALYRELGEEVGLEASDVKIISTTKDWLAYKLPKHLIRHYRKPLCIGQKQKWFLLKLLVPEEKICLHKSPAPEFDSWRWVDYWYPLGEVIYFKRGVYKQVLKEFAPLVLCKK